MATAPNDAAPDYSKPLVLDHSAFKMADGELRTDLNVAFGDGVYRFYIGPSEAMKLELGQGLRSSLRAVPHPVGIGTMYSRMAKGRALFNSGAPIWAGVGASDPGDSDFYETDIAQVIGHALVGGGEGVVDGKPVRVDAAAAEYLVARYVKGAPLAPLWTLAFAILGTRLFGRAPDPITQVKVSGNGRRRRRQS